MTDRELMQAAIALAREAAADGEVPVGAVVTRNGEIERARHSAAGGSGSANYS